MGMESLRFSWKEQRILLTICNAISVIWLGSLRRACVGCRLRGPGVSLRLGAGLGRDSRWFLHLKCLSGFSPSSPLASTLGVQMLQPVLFPAGKGRSRPCPPAPAPRQPRRSLRPPAWPRENNSGSELAEPSVFLRLNHFLQEKWH